MSAEKQREIASKGGRAAHEKGTAHEWTADEARSAGRKGGQVSRGGRGRLVVPPEAMTATTGVEAGTGDRLDANRPEGSDAAHGLATAWGDTNREPPRRAQGA